MIGVKTTNERSPSASVVHHYSLFNRRLHVFAAGWEIHNSRMTGATTGGDKPDYQDIRDDRVYTFFDLKKGKTKTFNVLLNASYLGRYYLPALSVEAMYDKSIQARKRGQWVEVNKPSEK